ncbi:MAG: hypothetical protein ACLTDV_13345 [Eubacterium sp.]
MPIFSAIRETFDIRKGDIRTYSPLTLAYIGDVFAHLVILFHDCAAQGTKAGSQLHNHVKPSCEGTFPVRWNICFRCCPKRKKRCTSVAECEISDYMKNASISDYRLRGRRLEALMGYLYLRIGLTGILN